MKNINTGNVLVYKSTLNSFDSAGMNQQIPCGAIALGFETLSNIEQIDTCGGGFINPGTRVPDIFPDSTITLKVQVNGDYYWVDADSFNAYMVICNGCCTTPPNPALAIPANFVATPGNVQVVMNWDDVTNATGYVLERSLSNSFTSPTVVYTGATSAFTDTGLTNGTPYFYRVRATEAGFPDSGYAFATATPNLPQLAMPLTFVGTPGSLQAVLDWADVASATNYVVDQALNSQFTSPTQIYSGATSAFTKTTLLAGTTYYFRVKAQASGFLDSPYAYVNVTPTA